MKYSQAQLKQIINEEIQNEIQSLDEGLGDIIKSVGKFFNAKYRQFKGLASSLGDTPQFWSKIKPVIAQDGMAAAKATASNKGNWSFDSYIQDERGGRIHIWKLLSAPDSHWNRYGEKLGRERQAGPLNLAPSSLKNQAKVFGKTRADDIDLSDVYSNGVEGSIANAMVYLAETVDVLAALTAIMDAGKATQGTVAKAESVRRFIDEEIDDMRESAFRKLGRMADSPESPYEPGSGKSRSSKAYAANQKYTQRDAEIAGEKGYDTRSATFTEEASQVSVSSEEFYAQISPSDKKKFLSIQNDIEARFKDLLGQAEAIEQKLMNQFKKGALQAELPRSAPELQEQKNKIVIKITSNKEK